MEQKSSSDDQKHTSAWICLSYVTWLTILILTATGCSSKGWRGWEGRLTKADNRLVLETDELQVGIWQTSDLAIHYRYVREGDRLTISGHVKRQARIKHFHRLRAWIWIHFLDGNGYVTETRRLWAQNGSDVYGQIRYRFNRDWQMPPGTVAMGFSYSGHARDRDVGWDFWRLP